MHPIKREKPLIYFSAGMWRVSRIGAKPYMHKLKLWNIAHDYVNGLNKDLSQTKCKKRMFR